MDHAWARNPRDALYRYSVIHQRYIELLHDGGQIFLEVEDWQNKTRGQAELKLLLHSVDGTEREEAFFFFAGVHDVHEFAERVFPWADVDVDEDFYEEHEHVPPDAVFQDDEEPSGYHIIPGDRPSGVRPYADNGEVASYRFELTLNEIGKAFASLDVAAVNLSEYPPYYVARVLARNGGGD